MSNFAEKLFFSTVKSDFKSYKTFFTENELFDIYDKISFITDYGNNNYYLYVVNELKNFPLEKKLVFWEKLSNKLKKELNVK